MMYGLNAILNESNYNLQIGSMSDVDHWSGSVIGHITANRCVRPYLFTLLRCRIRGSSG